MKRTILQTLALLTCSIAIAAPVGTAFTYQGLLTQSGNPANGLYEMQFTLFDAATNGNQVGMPVALAPVAVSNGLFTVSLDFGATPFNGSARWLEITINLFGSDMVPTILSPRQPITVTPYALHALNAASLMSFDPAPLDIKVNGQRVLRLEANTNSVPNVIGGHPHNFVTTGVVGATIAGGGGRGDMAISRNNGIQGDFGTISGGEGNFILAGSTYSTIGGGQQNLIREAVSLGTISGGSGNTLERGSSSSAIGGGVGNNAASLVSTIAGGRANRIGVDSVASTVGGGEGNIISTNAGYSAISGGGFNGIGGYADFSVIGGGSLNHLHGFSTNSTIAGGFNNSIHTGSAFSVIGGGFANTVAPSSPRSTIAGGDDNSIGVNSSSSSIGGGGDNNIAANSHASTIAGGVNHDIGAFSFASAIAGGRANSIGTNCGVAFIGGGINNRIHDNSSWAIIPGGEGNWATNRAFAAGSFARAVHMGAFVWADSFLASITSTNADSVTMRANGGYRLFSDSNLLAGVFLAPGAGSWTMMSDRNAKENFQPVNAQAVLDKVAALPLTTWNYKSQSDAVRHIGPMAQDFKAAFGVGETDTGITTIDADGVALAAIQGLNQKVEEQRTELQRKDAEIRELKKMMVELRELFGQIKK